MNDLGGTLMNESISRAAGAGWGQELAPEQMEALIRGAVAMPRQRTTLYGEPPAEQVARSFGAEPLDEPRNPHVNEARLERPQRLVRPVVVLEEIRSSAEELAVERPATALIAMWVVPSGAVGLTGS